VTREPDIKPEGSETPADEAEGAPRKERVLHTRVPAILERELKRLAESARMPVSNLVRAILEDALEVADKAGGRVEEQLRHAVDRVSKERESIRERARRLDPLERVAAFQPVTIASPTRCARCDRELATGDDARLGITGEPGPLLFFCVPCVPTRGTPPPSEGALP
jgi:vacuolar-type H+-ATPase subunit I/STV1